MTATYAPTSTSVSTPDPVDILRDVRVPTHRYYASDLPVFPAYATVHAKAAGLPSARFVHERPRQGAPFAPAVFATVDPSALRPFLTEEEWRAVSVITDLSIFERRVLLPDWRARLKTATDRVASTRLSTEQIRQLEVGGYLSAPPSGAPPPPGPCPVFAVNKTDGTLRMIWNGVPFNEVCHPPPPTHILPLEEQLRMLLHPEVLYYVSWDFRTWFCQIIVATAIATWFSTRTPDGRILLVNGVPMGWAWACAIAHALTLAFTRALLADLGAEDGEIASCHCIDNTVFAVRSTLFTAQQILVALRRCARRYGIVIKESSIEHGLQVDWLCYRLDAATHTACFKDAYVRKLRTTAQLAAHASRRQWALVEVWAIAGLAIFSVYAARIPLTVLQDVVRWLGAHTPDSEDRAAWHRATLFPHWLQLRRTLSMLAGCTVRPPPQPSTRLLAWCISDAAWSPQQLRYNAFVSFTAAATRLVVFRCRSTDIAARELCAANAGLAVPRPTGPGLVVMYGDNTVACAALRRGWALWSQSSVDLLQPAHAQREAEGVVVEVRQVRSDVCFPDAWTRPHADQHEGTWTWPRTCAHPFAAGVVCTCVQAHLRATGAPMEHLERWLASTAPPAR